MSSTSSPLGAGLGLGFLGLRIAPNLNPAILPLLSSTAFLGIAAFETITFAGFVKSAESSSSASSKSGGKGASDVGDRRSVARTVSSWWNNALAPALSVIVAVNAVTVFGGIYAARNVQARSTEWYIAAAGTAFGLAHYAYAPAISKTIWGAMEGYEGLDQTELVPTPTEDTRVLGFVKRWLHIHAWRTATADLPAAMCFAWLVFADKSAK